jgi:subtilisin-like proprotein convertase family protein/uncharacterized protein (DUF2141 family)
MRRARPRLRASLLAGLGIFVLTFTAAAGATGSSGDARFVIAGSRNASGFGLVRVFADTDANGTYETRADEFVPYSTSVGDGVRVAAGDFDGDRNDELVTASSENAAVKIFELGPGGGVGPLVDSLPGFTQGTYVAAGDLNADHRDELIIGADPGGEPKVKIFSDTNGDGELESAAVNTFNAYPVSFTGGVRVAAADTDGDATTDELVTGPGPGTAGLPVKIYDDVDKDGSVSDDPVDDTFVPYEAGFGGGVYVAAGPITGAGTIAGAEVIVSPASGQNRNVVIRTDGDSDGKVSDQPPFDQLPPPYGASFTAGVRVGAEDFEGGSTEVITAPGADAGSKPLKIYDDNGDGGPFLSDNPLADQFSAFPGTAGVFVAFARTERAVYSDIHTPIFLIDAGATLTTIQVPRSAGIVRDVDVFLGIGHTRNSDLSVVLTHSAGGASQTTTLFNGVGHNDHGFIVWLDDDFVGDEIGTAPDDPKDRAVTGTWRPQGLLSIFDGVDASGTWTLVIVDNVAGEVGALQQWSLKITY